jgi:hypothetical protein
MKLTYCIYEANILYLGLDGWDLSSPKFVMTSSATMSF